MKILSMLILVATSLQLVAETRSVEVEADLEEMLAKTGLLYTISSSGYPTFTTLAEDGTEQVVYVSPDPVEFGNYTLTKVFSIIYHGKEAPSENVLTSALKFNSILTTSRIQLAESSGGDSYTLTAMGLFPDSGDAKTLKRLILAIGNTVAVFKDENLANKNPLNDDLIEEKKDNLGFREEFEELFLGKTSLRWDRAKQDAKTPVALTDKNWGTTVTYSVDSSGIVRVEMYFPKTRFNLETFTKIEENYKWPDGEFYKMKDGSAAYYHYIDKAVQDDVEKRSDFIEKYLYKAYLVGCALAPEK